MNYITNQSLDKRIKELKDLIQELKSADNIQVKKLIKFETTKLIGEKFEELIKEITKQGLNEEKLLSYLEKTFGEDFKGGKFKPVKETVKEVIGKENFQGNAFVG